MEGSLQSVLNDKHGHLNGRGANSGGMFIRENTVFDLQVLWSKVSEPHTNGSWGNAASTVADEIRGANN